LLRGETRRVEVGAYLACTISRLHILLHALHAGKAGSKVTGRHHSLLVITMVIRFAVYCDLFAMCLLSVCLVVKLWSSVHFDGRILKNVLILLGQRSQILTGWSYFILVLLLLVSYSKCLASLCVAVVALLPNSSHIISHFSRHFHAHDEFDLVGSCFLC